MPSDLIVVSVPKAEGERFAILRRSAPPFSPLEWSSPLDWWRAIREYVESAAVLREDELRTELAGLGLIGAAADGQIQRARNMHAANNETLWEQTTRLGYRNRHGQEVIQKTKLAGTVPDQRIYVLRCRTCGCEYGANGSEIHDRGCPGCQSGPPGLAISWID